MRLELSPEAYASSTAAESQIRRPGGDRQLLRCTPGKTAEHRGAETRTRAVSNGGSSTGAVPRPGLPLLSWRRAPRSTGARLPCHDERGARLAALARINDRFAVSISDAKLILPADESIACVLALRDVK